MKKIKLKNKKYLFLGLIIPVIVAGILFENQISSLFVKNAEKGEYASSLKAGVTTYTVNYKTSAGPNTKGCNNKTYTPSFNSYSSNTFGPFPYPVTMNFKGTVDDNLKVNGVIVDKNMELRGDKCSHMHYLDYSKEIPANQTIKIEVVDNHGGEASINGTLTFTRKNSPKVNLKLIYEYNYENPGSGSVSNVSGSYDKYSEVIITAYPKKDSAVVWSTPCVGAKNTCTVNLFKDTEVYYTFVPKKKWWQKCKFEGIPGEVGFKLVCPW